MPTCFDRERRRGDLRSRSWSLVARACFSASSRSCLELMNPASTGKPVKPGYSMSLWSNESLRTSQQTDWNLQITYHWFAKCLSRECLRAGLPSFELFLHFLSLLLFFLELVLSHKTGNSKNLIWLLNTDLLKKRMQLRSKEAKGQPLVRFSTFSERFKLSPAANVRVESQKTNSQIL